MTRSDVQYLAHGGRSYPDHRIGRRPLDGCEWLRGLTRSGPHRRHSTSVRQLVAAGVGRARQGSERYQTDGNDVRQKRPNDCPTPAASTAVRLAKGPKLPVGIDGSRSSARSKSPASVYPCSITQGRFPR